MIQTRGTKKEGAWQRHAPSLHRFVKRKPYDTCAAQTMQYPFAVTGPLKSLHPPHADPAAGAMYCKQFAQFFAASGVSATY